MFVTIIIFILYIYNTFVRLFVHIYKIERTQMATTSNVVATTTAATTMNQTTTSQGTICKRDIVSLFRGLMEMHKNVQKIPLGKNLSVTNVLDHVFGESKDTISPGLKAYVSTDGTFVRTSGMQEKIRDVETDIGLLHDIADIWLHNITDVYPDYGPMRISICTEYDVWSVGVHPSHIPNMSVNGRIDHIMYDTARDGLVIVDIKTFDKIMPLSKQQLWRSNWPMQAKFLKLKHIYQLAMYAELLDAMITEYSTNIGGQWADKLKCVYGIIVCIDIQNSTVAHYEIDISDRTFLRRPAPYIGPFTIQIPGSTKGRNIEQEISSIKKSLGSVLQ